MIPTFLGDDEPDPVMWQRIATTPNGSRILITVWDNDPDTMEVCTRAPGAERWSPPLPVEVAP